MENQSKRTFGRALYKGDTYVGVFRSNQLPNHIDYISYSDKTHIRFNSSYEICIGIWKIKLKNA